MATLTLTRPHPCQSADPAPRASDGWLVVARSLDDRDGPAAEPSEPDVHAAVASIAADLRSRGLGPERALVLIKGMARGTLDARRTPLDAHERAERLAQIVDWTIEGYYA